jgi:hypothetical protein
MRLVVDHNGLKRNYLKICSFPNKLIFIKKIKLKWRYQLNAKPDPKVQVDSILHQIG